ncbi:staygreen family protein [Clostridium brassicae]|uniref:Staygreen family protein n=1 Tax=Clostridium brassicae TaxID=2999072 RepID=A0ABT4DCM5_9CLOT|nr:staygreen family protein [Clostridium brassicae]MCY6960037.1 staygreen family protein [Clostridium brassicae]
MGRLNPEKLFVEFKPGVTFIEPIVPRKYTLTHSDITAELFLTIGLVYDYEKINPMRDEVLGEWMDLDNKYFFNIYLYVGQFTPKVVAIRNKIFRKELPLAIEAIRYGDRKFFDVHKELDNVPIIVYFNSAIPYYNRVENWGTFSEYK